MGLSNLNSYPQLHAPAAELWAGGWVRQLPGLPSSLDEPVNLKMTLLQRA